jgi:hypothetical protein
VGWNVSLSLFVFHFLHPPFSFLFRQPMPLVDHKDDVIFAVMMSRGEGKDWDRVVSEATAAMKKIFPSLRLTAAQMHHRRGNFTALTIGISFGGGQWVRSART